MTTYRRAIAYFGLAAVAAGLACSPRPVSAQTAFPSRTVTIVLPYNAGGGTDAAARSIAKGLTQIWGQSVVVENVAGADGLIGTQKAARARPDGYTVLMSVPNLLLFKHSKNDGLFDATAALTPVSLVAKYPVVLIASKASGIQTVADMVAKCKGPNGRCSWGSGEQFSWLAGVSAFGAMGVDAVNVPYRGTAPVVNDVLGGHLTLGVGALAAPLPHHKSGGLRVVAALGDARSDSIPDVPTLKEAGIHGVAVGDGWYGLFAPKGMSAELLAAWHKALQQVQKDSSVTASLAGVNALPVFSSPAEFAMQVADDQKAFDALIAKHPLPQ